MNRQCSLCERRKEQKGEFCSFHTAALVNLERCYTFWNEALGGLEKDRYYSELEKLVETGSAVREVIRYLRSYRAVA